MAEISREDAIRELKLWNKDLEWQEDEQYGIKCHNKAISDMQKLEKIEQNLQHIDLAIRCAMCTNSMANDRGCDGGCVINDGMYKRVMNVIDKEIEQIIKGGDYN